MLPDRAILELAAAGCGGDGDVEVVHNVTCSSQKIPKNHSLVTDTMDRNSPQKDRETTLAVTEGVTANIVGVARPRRSAVSGVSDAMLIKVEIAAASASAE
jgi:hypothetical protein